MTGRRAVVVGAGVGGLTAAIELAGNGWAVTVMERWPGPGGKMRAVSLNGFEPIDAGPTVFTMRWIFDALFSAVDRHLDDYLELRPAARLARHGWMDGSQLDLFADPERTYSAIEEFADTANARGYERFHKRSQQVYAALAGSYIAASRPNALQLALRSGWRGLPGLWRALPLGTLWGALGRYFSDPRLRQLFARYATYCGSSPFRAPATLMLVAAVEQQGVFAVRGGMRAVAQALKRLGTELGVEYRFDCAAAQIRLGSNGRVTAVVGEDGKAAPADAVIFNGDVAGLAAGALGAEAARALPASSRYERSLSAITWCAAAQASGFNLDHHNVFFGDDYRDEFRAVFERGEITRRPTVYLCAQDRGFGIAASGPEPLLILINAPARGGGAVAADQDLDEAWSRACAVTAAAGLQLRVRAVKATGPRQFGELFPGSGGSLYGPANHGWRGSFNRLGEVSGTPGLYLAGGSVHPGPGVPMAAQSGRLAALRVVRDLG